MAIVSSLPPTYLSVQEIDEDLSHSSRRDEGDQMREVAKRMRGFGATLESKKTWTHENFPLLPEVGAESTDTVHQIMWFMHDSELAYFSIAFISIYFSSPYIGVTYTSASCGGRQGYSWPKAYAMMWFWNHL
ncbi:hypothetical protein TNCV_120451 [Trichonephila clavipes]|nr:hypothetical protein TNCV_120451 [Trichonephila clavipes]